VKLAITQSTKTIFSATITFNTRPEQEEAPTAEHANAPDAVAPHRALILIRAASGGAVRLSQPPAFRAS
jgi:hypothetical protein